VRASEQIGLTQCFVAMHWGEEFVSGRSATGQRLAGVNALTSPAFCPSSKQPELKHAAVKILKAELPWRLLALAWLPQAQAFTVRDALRARMDQFSYATVVPFGRERCGVLLRAADHEPAPDALLQEIEALLGLDAAGALHYADKRRGQRRSMKLVADGDSTRLDAFLLGGDISAEAWVKPLLQDGLAAQAYGRLLLLPGSKPPVAMASKGRQVCSCFDAGEAQIGQALEQCSGSASEQLTQLQQRLKCGTNCGSCLPELRRLVRLRQQAA
jgi:assimilatory nitrate reductase catalytic subunit